MDLISLQTSTVAPAGPVVFILFTELSEFESTLSELQPLLQNGHNLFTYWSHRRPVESDTPTVYPA